MDYSTYPVKLMNNITNLIENYAMIINLNNVLTELTLNPPEGIIAGPINEENFFEWEALIT